MTHGQNSTEYHSCPIRCRRLIVAAWIGLTWASIGCSPEVETQERLVARTDVEAVSNAKATENVILGQVMLNGKTSMPKGVLVLYSVDEPNQAASYGEIRPDGSFQMLNVPSGQVILLLKESLNSEIREEFKQLAAKRGSIGIQRRHQVVRETPGSGSTGPNLGPKHQGGEDPKTPEAGNTPAMPAVSTEFLPPESQGVPVIKTMIENAFKTYGSMYGAKLIRRTVQPGENRFRIHLVVDAAPAK